MKEGEGGIGKGKRKLYYCVDFAGFLPKSLYVPPAVGFNHPLMILHYDGPTCLSPPKTCCLHSTISPFQNLSRYHPNPNPIHRIQPHLSRSYVYFVITTRTMYLIWPSCLVFLVIFFSCVWLKWTNISGEMYSMNYDSSVHHEYTYKVCLLFLLFCFGIDVFETQIKLDILILLYIFS